MQFRHVDVQPPAAEHAIPLTKLAHRQCRFIVRETPKRVLFCGAPTSAGTSWCAWHRRIVYVTADREDQA
jgi:hypothetical protein